MERLKIVEVSSWATKNGDRWENGDYLYGKKRRRAIGPTNVGRAP